MRARRTDLPRAVHRQRSTMVSLRIPRELEDKLSTFAEHEEQTFSEAVRRLLYEGLRHVDNLNTAPDKRAPSWDERHKS